ncbi:MAG: DUF2202 domain-containing protein [Bacteroidota bacterium]|nr:DUF2202 domain-containing protein [Bacteroidota bacterium]MDX5449030.1 DUF2202 domain-containing protein [Bacteroidota bacterium]MDX5504582.1 DUF2202 domain-containing protein [Bacteroidota bacterium]
MRSSITLLAAGLVFLTWGCEKDKDPTPPPTNNGLLTQAESDHLILMREEEKMARDLYLAFKALWNSQQFANISASEQTHMDLCLVEIQKFGLTDPVEGFIEGDFPSAGMQQIYDDFLAIGQQSEVKALEQGAEVEEIDILDLQNGLDNFIEHPDLVLLYSNLQKASRNHLRAFYSGLQLRGVTYVPRHMSQADFDLIVNSPHEH